MTRKWLLFTLIVGLAVSEAPPYYPRGWRPIGQSFNPSNSRSYGPPIPSNTYGPQNGISVQTSTAVPDVTPASTSTTTEEPTTTTPKSREPTTPFAEEDFANGPALAVANSFAFNRPVYVYNGFPYFSAGYTVLK